VALLDDVLATLDAQGVTGGATGWTAFASFLPDTTDKVVAVYETGGEAPLMAMQGANYPRPTFQVRVRGAVRDYQDTRTKAQEIYTALHRYSVNNQTFFAVQSGPLSIGNDANDRPNLTINFRVMNVGGF